MTKYPLKKFSALVENSRSILQIAHVNPDGDTLGSNLALQQSLQENGYKTKIACIHKPASNYRFLPSIDSVQQTFDPKEHDLIITVDVADLGKMSGFYNDYKDFFDSTPMINIDHHATNNRFGTVAIVDDKAASAGQIMYYLLRDLGAVFDNSTATNLMTALYFDTGSFQHSNTTPEVLRIAAELMKHDVPTDIIAFELFQKKDLGLLRLWGQVLSRLRIDYDHAIAWVFVSREDFEKTGTSPKDIEGLVALIHGIPKTRMTVVLSERENGKVKGSIRTVDGVDASYYASVFGGGGHPKAAGFSAKISPQKVNPVLNSMLSHYAAA